jgi:hypothetical protein
MLRNDLRSPVIIGTSTWWEITPANRLQSPHLYCLSCTIPITPFFTNFKILLSFKFDKIKFLTNPLPCTSFAKRGDKNCLVLSNDLFNEHQFLSPLLAKEVQGRVLVRNLILSNLKLNSILKLVKKGVMGIVQDKQYKWGLYSWFFNNDIKSNFFSDPLSLYMMLILLWYT